MSREPLDRLGDIVDRIDAAMTARSRLLDAEEAGDAALVAIAYDAILYDLLVIGEAVKALPSDVTDQRPEIEWSLVARLRDRLAHHYHRVDAHVIVATIDESLPTLRSACAILIDLANEFRTSSR